MKRNSAISVLLIALCMSAVPFTTFAKKGGNGGGNPGGGNGGDETPVLTGQPNFLYTTRAGLNSGEAIVFSNADGTAKKYMVTASLARLAEFIPGENAVIFDYRAENDGPTLLNKFTYILDLQTNEPVITSTQSLDQTTGIQFVSISPSGSWVIYRAYEEQTNVVRIQNTNPIPNQLPTVIKLLPDGPTSEEHPWITDIDWLSETRIALHYAVFTAAGELSYSEIAVLDLDPANPVLVPTIPLTVFRVPRDEYMNPDGTVQLNTIPGVEGVALSMKVWIDTIMVKVKGKLREERVYESMAYSLLFNYIVPEDIIFEPWEPLVLGRFPHFSPDDQFVLSTYNNALLRTSINSSTPESERQVVIEDRDLSFHPDWNSNL